jgi:hypothetical protein
MYEKQLNRALYNKTITTLNLINMRFNGAGHNNIELDLASFNTVVLCSIYPHIDFVQVQFELYVQC